MPRLILYPRNSKPYCTRTIRVFVGLIRTPNRSRTAVAVAKAVRASAADAQVMTPCFQHRANQAKDPAIRYPLGHECEQLVMIDRPEKVAQVAIDNPLAPRFQFLPDLAQGVVLRPPSSVSEAGIIEHRLEDGLQPIQQRLLAHPVVDRGNPELAMRPRLARLRDALLAHRLRSVDVLAQFLVQPAELLFTHLGKVVDGLPVDTPGAPVRPSRAPRPSRGSSACTPCR